MLKLTNEQIVLLSKAIDAKSVKLAKSLLEPGSYQVQASIELNGSFERGIDTDKASTVSIPTLAALALVLKNSGITRAASLKVLRNALGETIKMDSKERKALIVETGVQEMIETVQQELVASMPRTPVQGSIKVSKATKIVGL